MRWKEYKRKMEKILCRWLEKKRLVVNPDGQVHPCCYFGNYHYMQTHENKDNRNPTHPKKTGKIAKRGIPPNTATSMTNLRLRTNSILPFFWCTSTAGYNPFWVYPFPLTCSILNQAAQVIPIITVVVVPPAV